jgi:ribonuclease HII
MTEETPTTGSLGTLRRQMFAALETPNYRSYFIGNAISMTGTWMQIVAQGWLVLQLTGSATALGIVTAKEIDEINILNASILAMHRALDGLKIRPEYVVVDGNKFKPYGDTPHETVVKGDGKLMNIAAASILAKTYRDDYMNRLHEEYPHYDWNHNKGYPTAKHRAGIKEHGLTPYHRMSYNLLGDGQLSLDF